MERVDVAVVGGGYAGLAAAWGAAEGGVRVLLAEQKALPSERSGIVPLRSTELVSLGLDASQTEARIEAVEVRGHLRAELGPDLALHLVRNTILEQHLLRTARAEGCEIRDHSQVTRVDVEGDRWVVTLAHGEPIQAHVLIAADGARSQTLRTLGVADAQRFSRGDAEVVRFLIASWDRTLNLPSGYSVHPGRGPLERWELLVGPDVVTLAVGPTWGPNEREALMLQQAASALKLDGPPSHVEVEEWRLDGLPIPATFDGGLVIGSAAGHRPHEPLLAAGPVLEAGRLAGRAAARAVRRQDWSARTLGLELGQEYRWLAERPTAERAYEARNGGRADALATVFRIAAVAPPERISDA